MIHALIAKNKIGFIDGSIQSPPKKDKPSEFALWNQCKIMILSWLTHSVEPDLAKGVIHAKTTHHVWVDFKDQFLQKMLIQFTRFKSPWPFPPKAPCQSQPISQKSKAFGMN